MSNKFSSAEKEGFGDRWRGRRQTDLSCMVGKTFDRVTQDGCDSLMFHHEQGAIEFYYEPDCCANCTIEDVAGDLNDLVGSPILMAELVTSYTNPPDRPDNTDDSFTWSFYKFATAKGYVTVRWYGSSNGYYSEEVSTKWIPNEVAA